MSKVKNCEGIELHYDDKSIMERTQLITDQLEVVMGYLESDKEWSYSENEKMITLVGNLVDYNNRTTKMSDKTSGYYSPE